MDLMTTLHRSGGIVALARQLNLDSPECAALAESLLPPLTEALRCCHERLGADGLLRILAEQGGVGLAATIMGVEPVDPAQGWALLDRLGIDASDIAVEGDAVLAARLLPLLAMLIGGYLAGIELNRGDAHGALAELLVAPAAAANDRV